MLPRGINSASSTLTVSHDTVYAENQKVIIFVEVISATIEALTAYKQNPLTPNGAGKRMLIAQIIALILHCNLSSTHYAGSF
jgi:hypothetical protein